MNEALALSAMVGGTIYIVGVIIFFIVAANDKDGDAITIAPVWPLFWLKRVFVLLKK